MEKEKELKEKLFEGLKKKVKENSLENYYGKKNCEVCGADTKIVKKRNCTHGSFSRKISFWRVCKVCHVAEVLKDKNGN
jgi:hypothetical protein